MLLTDLVILGRACPEPLKDGRVTVCLGGWSETWGFVRVYPTRPKTDWKRWDVVEIEVEENERDSRDESWKIVGSKDEWDTLHEKIKVVGRVDSGVERRNIIGNLTDPCVNSINEQKRSLGIIDPAEILRLYFAENPNYGEMFQMGLPGLTELDDVKVKRDFPNEPRIRYQCPDCQTQQGYHDQQILEWGFYEWLRKNPDNKEQVWENARFNRDDTDIYLFVGNQAAHRTSFMVISVLRVPSGPVAKAMFPPVKWRQKEKGDRTSH
jgi:hypothetical protein